MTDRLEVIIKGTDGVTRVFNDIGSSGTRMGATVEAGGKRAQLSLKSTSDEAKRFGLAIGVAISGLALASSKAAADAEASTARMNVSFENAGLSVTDYQDKIDQLASTGLKLAFDDEDVQDSLATLIGTTKDFDKATRDLAMAEDISRAKRISLADATQLVQAAEVGRFRGFAQLGIVLDATATKEDYLAAAQERYAGSSEAYAATSAAGWDRLGNTIENRLEGVGAITNKYQGLILMVGGIAPVVGPAVSAFKDLATAERTAAVASGALDLAMGPVGIIAAGLAAAGAIYYLTTRESDNEKQTKALAQATQSYTQTLIDETTALANLGLLHAAEDMQTYLEAIDSAGLLAQSRIDNVTKAMDYLTLNQQTLVSGIPAGEFMQGGQFFEDYALSILQANGAMADGFVTADELNAAMTQLASGYELTKGQAAALETAMAGVTTAMADPSLFGKELGDRAYIILTQMHDGVITVDDAITQLTALPVDQYYNRAAAAADGLTFATVSLTAQLTSQNAAVSEDTWLMGTLAAGMAKANQGMDELAGGAVSAAGSIDPLNAQLRTLATSLKSDLSGAASSAYNRVVGFTSGMVASIDTSKKWADALIAPVGTFSILDQLYDSSSQTYIDAQQAQIDITNDSARATEAMNRIQIEQAGNVARGADATAGYLEYLGKLPPAEQEVQLAWADSDIAGRAMSIADMAANFGTMDEAQRAAFGSMVTSAAATDPALAAVLTSLGLIHQEADGTYTLTVDGSDTKANLDDIEGALNRIADALEVQYMLSVGVTLDDALFWQAIDNLPDSKLITIYYQEGGYYGRPGYALGGVTGSEPDHSVQIPHRAVGGSGPGGAVLVGENGPEIIYPPAGSYVLNNAGTNAVMNQGGDGHTIIQNFHQPIYVTPPTGDIFHAIAQQTIGAGL